MCLTRDQALQPRISLNEFSNKKLNLSQSCLKTRLNLKLNQSSAYLLYKSALRKLFEIV